MTISKVAIAWVMLWLGIAVMTYAFYAQVPWPGVIAVGAWVTAVILAEP